jgi:general nucleoside transport system permease protein
VNDVTTILDSTARLAAPLLFVALGELTAQRGGAIDVSVEGMMLAGAFAAAAMSDIAGSPTVGMLAGVAAGLVVATMQAYLSHRLTVNQFVVGIALNVLVLGLTGYLLQTYQIRARSFGDWSIPVLHRLPLVGEPFFQQAPPFFLLYGLVPGTAWLLWRSRWGLELRASGENPTASFVNGVPVDARRRQAILFCGACAGWSGAYLSVGVVGSFSPNMTAGRGFIAIAAVLFGAWTVRGAVIGCLLFGGADALRLALPPLGYELNPQLLVAAPYLLAVFALLFFAQTGRQPRALGISFTPRARGG